ncbi:MAG: dephospho-CoA kinase [Rhodospirillales bacterium]|nr:dephospho-CoA kinase [Rhodospirillales bacterium]
MSFKLGLTGSIGMGKTRTAQIFVAQGCGYWDADASVHRAYDVNGAAITPISALFPEVVEAGAVSREAIKDLILKDSTALKKIEQIVHPLVALDRERFAQYAEEDILIYDIPLLFETDGHRRVDAVACVHIASIVQRRRVMGRGNMSSEQLEFILSKQMPIEEKLAMSDYCIETDTLPHATQQVLAIIADIKERFLNA